MSKKIFSGAHSWVFFFAALVSVALHAILVFSVSSVSPPRRANYSLPVELSIADQPGKQTADRDGERERRGKAEPSSEESRPATPANIKPKIGRAGALHPDKAGESPAAQSGGNGDGFAGESSGIAGAELESESGVGRESVPSLGKEDLDFKWSDFETTFGREAEQAREAAAETKRKSGRGAFSFGGLKDKVQAALDKRQGKVKGDNQESLGSRAVVFRQYIELVNSRIYPRFDQFLLSLSSVQQELHRRFGTRMNPFYVPPPDLEESSRVLKDLSMNATTELEIRKSGLLGDVRLIRPSGNSTFDGAAVWSIFKSAPFPPPPDTILSWNDSAYLHWRFHRKKSLNGSSAGQGFVLKQPLALEPTDFRDASVAAD